MLGMWHNVWVELPLLERANGHPQFNCGFRLRQMTPKAFLAHGLTERVRVDTQLHCGA